jgi:hypothetical protein
MGAFYDDFDLAREAAHDRWHDEPSPKEDEEAHRKMAEHERDVASRPVGSRVTRKAA